MTYQFMHVESYSRSTPKKQNKNKTPKLSVAGVMAEATRQPGNHPHVDEPSPPVLIYGNPPENIEQKCEEWAAGTPDAKGRAARKDALCLLAGVFSMPRQETTPEAWEKVKTDAVKWLKDKYGDRLETVIEHTDEANPHCHFYVIPRPGERFDSIHDGHFAERKAKENGKNRKEQNVAYRAAMREFQNGYFDDVGSPNGLVRLGPGKRRLTRAQWVAEKAQGRAIGDKFQALEAKITGADQKLAMADAAISGAEATVDRIRSEALAEVRELQKQAKKDAEKAMEDAHKKGIEEGRSEALEQFGKSSLWGKLSGLLSSKDKEIVALKADNKALGKDLKQARSETKKIKGLLASVKAAGKNIAHKFLGLEKERDRALERAEKAERQRDKLKAQVCVLKERDSSHAGLDKQLSDIAWERDSERARADQILRQLSKLEASHKAQDAPTAPSARFANLEFRQMV